MRLPAQATNHTEYAKHTDFFQREKAFCVFCALGVLCSSGILFHLENLIYNELRNWGFSVDVGNIQQQGRSGQTRQTLEVDFVANQGHRRYYIQSAYQIPDDEKREQELRPLLKINDAFRKILVPFDGLPPYHNEDGILVLALEDFLKGPESMDA